jgi:prepilin-type N-terminal cleavage/methylation domain-containing protein
MHINLKNKKNTPKGFSLLEMMAVLGIFGIISSIVMFNYGKFTSETVLTNMAYEIALSIREAQIYGVSVRGGESVSFDAPYGIYIPPTTNNLNQYILFKDDNEDDNIDTSTCLGSLECVTPYTIQRNIFIESVKLKLGNSGGNCPEISDGFSILFKRPNPEPFFSDNRAISQVEIKLRSRDNTAFRYVIIANNGQISVQNDSICD